MVDKVMVVLSQVQVEGTPCPDCGTPFMVSVVEVRPIGGPAGMLVAPGTNGGKQPQIPAKPVKAWRLCLHCLRRETTKPVENGPGWEMVSAIPGKRALRRKDARNH